MRKKSITLFKVKGLKLNIYKTIAFGFSKHTLTRCLPLKRIEDIP
jgi:hypothetical protein